MLKRCTPVGFSLQTAHTICVTRKGNGMFLQKIIESLFPILYSVQPPGG